jgi:hypothetical protein
MKIVVYSVNTGGYDNLNSPSVVDPNIRYILFTDNKYYRSDIWEVNHVDFVEKGFDNRKIARFIKINPHLVLPEHDVSIWVDNCYRTKFNNAQNVLNEISFNDSVMCFKHDARNCIYEEAKIIIKDKLDYKSIVDQQMIKYKNIGFPSNNGLFDSGFTIRKNSIQVKTFNEKWWEEVKNHSGRDQLSQVFSSWATNTRIDPIKIGVSIYDNKFLNPKIKHPKRWTVN